jgi:hypothetical protein
LHFSVAKNRALGLTLSIDGNEAARNGTNTMKNAYEIHHKETREMLSIFLKKLGFLTMAKEVKTDDISKLPQYARVIANKINADLKGVMVIKFQALGLI